MTITKKAYAKCNIFLEILGKRKDGFHNIHTLMVLLTLHDTLTFTQSDSGKTELACNVDEVPVDDNNLVIKAVDIFSKKLRKKISLKINLHKEIPHGAGLGGGSSDAAATLLALNEIHDNHFNLRALHKMAEAIGSDVPFFLYGKPAFCSGRGNKIKMAHEFEDFDWELPITLLKFPFGISAGSAYNGWQESLKVRGVFVEPQVCPWGIVYNDLERSVYRKYPILGLLKNWLLEQPEAHAVILCGSGSTLVTFQTKPFGGVELAQRAREKFGDNLWTNVGSTLA